MHLRRALLLFAIVLGLAALAAAVAGPRGQDEPATGPRRAERRSPTAAPSPAPARTERLRFSVGSEPDRRRLRVGRPAVVTVAVRTPGQVELRDLGLTAAADSVTPARIDVLVDEPGSFAVRITPARGGRPKVVGILRAVRAG